MLRRRNKWQVFMRRRGHDKQSIGHFGEVGRDSKWISKCLLRTFSEIRRNPPELDGAPTERQWQRTRVRGRDDSDRRVSVIKAREAQNVVLGGQEVEAWRVTWSPERKSVHKDPLSSPSVSSVGVRRRVRHCPSISVVPFSVVAAAAMGSAKLRDDSRSPPVI